MTKEFYGAIGEAIGTLIGQGYEATENRSGIESYFGHPSADASLTYEHGNFRKLLDDGRYHYVSIISDETAEASADKPTHGLIVSVDACFYGLRDGSGGHQVAAAPIERFVTQIGREPAVDYFRGLTRGTVDAANARHELAA